MAWKFSIDAVPTDTSDFDHVVIDVSFYDDTIVDEANPKDPDVVPGPKIQFRRTLRFSAFASPDEIVNAIRVEGQSAPKAQASRDELSKTLTGQVFDL